MKLYLIEILHQTTTPFEGFCPLSELYLIEILHQTTTAGIAQPATFELYLIEILHQTTTKRSRTRDRSRCILSKFYIKPQRLCRCSSWPSGCILSKFYIKPQRGLRRNEGVVRCILSKFYIKPQQQKQMALQQRCCILSKFYIKPQQSPDECQTLGVVSYRNSTSNHNFVKVCSLPLKLYLIEILHQTTTPQFLVFLRFCCILSKFYIKPQLQQKQMALQQSCILSKFYIKPQHAAKNNMNLWRCILSKFYIKPQRPTELFGDMAGCILSKFYIKPQLRVQTCKQAIVVSYRNSTSNHNTTTNEIIIRGVVSYRNSTSNHNTSDSAGSSLTLYLIEILHQTTTSSRRVHRL